MSSLVWKIITLVLFILIILVGGYSYVKYSQIQTPNPSPQASPNESPKLNNHLLIIQNTQNDQFLVTEEGKIINQLASKASLGKDQTGRISPDLKLFAYNSLESSSSASPNPQYALKLKNLKTQEELYIAKPQETSYSFPYFSADSKYIVYSTDTKTYLYNIENKTTSQIAAFSSKNSFLFFPDNKTLLITEGKSTYKYNLQNKTYSKFTEATYPSIPSSHFATISTDSKYLVINREDGLYSLGLDGKNPQKITDNNSIQLGGILNNTHTLIYSKCVKASEGEKTYLYSYNLETKEQKQLLLGAAVSYKLSPQGDKIAFTDSLSDTNRGYFLLTLSTGKIEPFLGSLTDKDPSKENNLNLIDWQ